MRGGIQTRPEESLRRNNVLWWLSSTFESLSKAPSITVAEAPRTVNQSTCVSYLGVPALGSPRKCPDSGVPLTLFVELCSLCFNPLIQAVVTLCLFSPFLRKMLPTSDGTEPPCCWVPFHQEQALLSH